MVPARVTDPNVIAMCNLFATQSLPFRSIMSTPHTSVVASQSWLGITVQGLIGKPFPLLQVKYYLQFTSTDVTNVKSKKWFKGAVGVLFYFSYVRVCFLSTLCMCVWWYALEWKSRCAARCTLNVLSMLVPKPSPNTTLSADHVFPKRHCASKGRYVPIISYDFLFIVFIYVGQFNKFIWAIQYSSPFNCHWWK